MTLTQQQEHIGKKWTASKPQPRVRWWQSNRIKRHINSKAGMASDVMHAGFHHLLQSLGTPFEKGISLACGAARKEMRALHAGIVSHFDCYEFSQQRINQGREFAREAGLANRITFHHADAMALDLSDDFDLVYWNNALHHMMDVEFAIQWSRERLCKGGYFAMDDYVGPTGFQWDDLHLQHVNDFRARLADCIFKHPRDPSKRLERFVVRPDPEQLWAIDPSEAADSGRILPSLLNCFDHVDIIKTGGAVYSTALNNILANIDENADVLDEALALDDRLIDLGYTNYAIALAAN